MFIEKTVTEFLDMLASKEPTPGGGSAAALGGAQAAALVSMVCNLTIGKKGYEGVQQAMSDLLAKTEALRKELPQLLEADTQVYDGRLSSALQNARTKAGARSGHAGCAQRGRRGAVDHRRALRADH